MSEAEALEYGNVTGCPAGVPRAIHRRATPMFVGARADPSERGGTHARALLAAASVPVRYGSSTRTTPLRCHRLCHQPGVADTRSPVVARWVPLFDRRSTGEIQQRGGRVDVVQYRAVTGAGSRTCQRLCR